VRLGYVHSISNSSRLVMTHLSWPRRVHKREVLILASLSVLLLSEIVCFQPIDLVRASDALEARRMAATFLERVAELNLSADADRSSGVDISKLPGSKHFMTDVKITVEKNDHIFDTITTFLDDRFWCFTSYDLSWPPKEEKNVSECLKIASLAIARYIVLFNASYADGLVEMLSDTIMNQCLTTENTNALLNVTVKANCSTPLDYERFTIVHWYKKIENQFVSELQEIRIIISKGGLVTGFSDNVGINYVATTSIRISEEQAANISRPFAEVFGEEHGQQIVWTTTSMSWDSDHGSQRGDDLAVFPVWVFNALYNETRLGVFGYEVSVWADNGQIVRKGPIGLFRGEETGSANSASLWLFLGVVAIVIIVTCSGTYLRRRKRRWKETR